MYADTFLPLFTAPSIMPSSCGLFSPFLHFSGSYGIITRLLFNSCLVAHFWSPNWPSPTGLLLIEFKFLPLDDIKYAAISTTNTIIENIIIPLVELLPITLTPLF